jgi:tetratricopeptide (TPR) repeat protein/CheY-like chemotaxis protein
VVLLGFEAESSAASLVAALERRGVRVHRAAGGAQAVVAVRARNADVVCVQIPLAGCDPIAICAALKEGPAPPALVLVDPAGDATLLGDALPEELRPDAWLPLAPNVSGILVALQRVLDGARSRESGDEAAAALVQPLFAELLMDLHAAGESGVLEVRAVGVRTNVHFVKGEPVLAEGGTVRETLGRLLVQRGTLSQADYVRVVERMTATPVDHEPLRMGEVLVELGLMTPGEVHEALRAQTRDKILACFQWDRLDHVFRPSESLPEHATGWREASVEALLWAGLRLHFDANRLAPILDPHEGRYPVLEGDLGELSSRYRLAAPEQRWLQNLNGERTLAAVFASPGLDALHARQLVATLLLARRLQLRETPRKRSGAAPTQERVDPARRAPRVSRLTPGATAAPAPRRAPAEPTRPSTPAPPAAAAPAAPASSPAPAASPSPPQASKAVPVPTPPAAPIETPSLVLRALRLARPRPAGGPNSAAERKGRLGAEEALQRGKVLLRNGAVAGAREQFERAVGLAPEELEYRLYAAWTEQLLEKADDARLVARAKTRALALQLLKQDRRHAKAHAILGVMLCDEGELEAAERHFRAALAADPEEIDAKRGLRLVTQRLAR